MRLNNMRYRSRYIAPTSDIPSFSLHLATRVRILPPHFAGQKISIFCSLNELPQ
jgi:hypothetical protein